MSPLNFGCCRLAGGSAAGRRDGGGLHDRCLHRSSFAAHAIASEPNVVKTGSGVSLEHLWPLGRGLQTGATVGETPERTEPSLDVSDVMLPSCRIVGVIQDDVVWRTFSPALLAPYRQACIPFSRIVKFRDGDVVAQAMVDSDSGVTLKTVLRFAAVAA